MTVCKFWLQGNCKFGDRCRFEHTNRNQSQTQSQSNRFGALSGGRGNNDLLTKYQIDLDNLQKDLTSEVPQWILSAYAPGRGAPQQLFGGYPREQSFEEMRLHFMEGVASGNEQGALNQAQELYQDAQKQMQNASQNLNDAAQYVVSAENQHPNRIDICREATQGAPFGEFLVSKRQGALGSGAQASNPFSSGNASTSSPFGGAGAGTTQASAFGQPSQTQSSAFGQPQQTQGSAFGQPSTMGAKPNPFGTPAFGQPANATSTSAFGQPAQGSAFGQPSQTQGSAFGQPAQSSTFGQPQQTQGSAFGQPSTIGAKPNPFGTPSFGQPASATQGSAFGQPAQAQGNAFGQPSQMGAKPNPFATPSTGGSAFGAAANNTPNAFGQPAQQKPNPFASNSQPAANPFASTTTTTTTPQTNAFAQASQSGGDAMQDSPAAATPAQNSPFGTTGQSSGGAGAFGQPSQPKPNPFAQAAPSQPGTVTNTTTNPYPPESTKQHPNGYISKDGFGNLSAFKGLPVLNKNGRVGVNAGGKFVRICFPDGPPQFNKDTALPADAYDAETLKRWMAFEAKGGSTVFEDGVMPELPPPREATTWDF